MSCPQLSRKPIVQWLEAARGAQNFAQICTRRAHHQTSTFTSRTDLFVARECCNYEAALRFVLEHAMLQRLALSAGHALCACSFFSQHLLSLGSTQQLAQTALDHCIAPWRIFQKQNHSPTYSWEMSHVEGSRAGSTTSHDS